VCPNPPGPACSPEPLLGWPPLVTPTLAFSWKASLRIRCRRRSSGTVRRRPSKRSAPPSPLCEARRSRRPVNLSFRYSAAPAVTATNPQADLLCTDLSVEDCGPVQSQPAVMGCGRRTEPVCSSVAFAEQNAGCTQNANRPKSGRHAARSGGAIGLAASSPAMERVVNTAKSAPRDRGGANGSDGRDQGNSPGRDPGDGEYTAHDFDLP